LGGLPRSRPRTTPPPPPPPPLLPTRQQPIKSIPKVIHTSVTTTNNSTNCIMSNVTAAPTTTATQHQVSASRSSPRRPQPHPVSLTSLIVWIAETKVCEAKFYVGMEKQIIGGTKKAKLFFLTSGVPPPPFGGRYSLTQ